MSLAALAPRTAVRCCIPGGPAIYGRVMPGTYAKGVVHIRLTADHPRARKGERMYVRAAETRPYRRGRHASGVHVWGPDWLRWLLHRR